MFKDLLDALGAITKPLESSMQRKFTRREARFAPRLEAHTALMAVLTQAERNFGFAPFFVGKAGSSLATQMDEALVKVRQVASDEGARAAGEAVDSVHRVMRCAHTALRLNGVANAKQDDMLHPIHDQVEEAGTALKEAEADAHEAIRRYEGAQRNELDSRA